ncbi:MAG: thiamine diphosphokinase [Holosporales bacterium]|nr:thiamine diphosphokinase [Holosporales bacterium]
MNIADYKSVLCLHGALPGQEFFRAVKLPIIAADGAANILDLMEIRPDVIIGDMDSVNPEILEKVRHVRLPSQELSDFQKAIQYAKRRSLLPSIICGMNSGYLDHIVNNFSIFMSTDSALVDDGIVGFTLQPGQKKLRVKPETKLSVFGAPRCVISSSGLRWELRNHLLEFPGATSCCNRAVTDDVVVNVHEGKALAFVYLRDVVDAGVTPNSRH